MRQIVVTGASGFIGAHLARRLIGTGASLTLTGRNRAALKEFSGHARCLALDLAVDSLDDLLAGADAVVHCAARSSPWGRREDFQRDNVIATRRLVEASTRAGVHRFVHLSSPSIYFQFGDRRNLTESFNAPAKWITPYAESKWLGEELLRAPQASSLQSIILRPRAVFGPGDSAIFPRIVRLAQRGWFPLFNGGSAQIDLSCVDNVIDAIQASLNAPDSACGRAYNICNAQPQRVVELLAKVFAALEMSVRFRDIPRPVALLFASALEKTCRMLPGYPEPPLTPYSVGVLAYDQTLDITAAATHLGFAPKKSIDQGIAEFAQWWRACEA